MNSLYKSIRLLGTMISGKRVDTSHITGACEILEVGYGHFKSASTQRAVDNTGSPIPWFTYPAIDHLSQLDLSTLSMLEWGSGNSSRWFSSRVKSLYSVEHNEEWLNHVKSFALTNQTIVFSTQDKYASTALEFQRTFDLILIDGVEREACGEVAISLLSNGGMIILDNSDRHPDISEKLRAQDLIQVDFHGFGPINPYTWTTSVFMRRDYRISPIDRQPRIPIGGGY